MLRTKEIMTAVGTLGIAVGLGFALQSGDMATERYGAASRPMAAHAGTPPDDPTQVGGFLNVDGMSLSPINETDVVPILGRMPIPNEGPSPVAPHLPYIAPDRPPAVDIRSEGCQMRSTADPMPGAMVQVSLTAPCAVNERLTVHHNGMMFTATTDAAGHVDVLVPALQRHAVFILTFANGDGAVAQTQVADLENYDRVAIQWRGGAGFQLHAREFGAHYGQPGHVWSGAVDGSSYGTLVQLGDPTVAEPLKAEVYSLASDVVDRYGNINLTVETEVTAGNCNQDITAQSLEITRDGGLKTRDLTLAVPGCDTIGSFLVLNNLVSDLKVASN